MPEYFKMAAAIDIIEGPVLQVLILDMHQIEMQMLLGYDHEKVKDVYKYSKTQEAEYDEMQEF